MVGGSPNSYGFILIFVIPFKFFPYKAVIFQGKHMQNGKRVQRQCGNA